MKRPVVFDLDGVLADFYHGYWRICRDLKIPEPPIGRWDAFWNPDVWSCIKDSPTFWRHLPPLVHRDTFMRIRDISTRREIYFATSRPGKCAYEQTCQWLEWRGIVYPAVILTAKKGEFAKAVDAAFLLDDKAGNAIYTSYESPNTEACLLNAPYNQFNPEIVGSRVVRVKSVDEFLDRVEAD